MSCKTRTGLHFMSFIISFTLDLDKGIEKYNLLQKISEKRISISFTKTYFCRIENVRNY